jgi:hypothetical protein
VDIALWIIAGLLGVAMKLTRPKEKLAAFGWGWVEDFSGSSIKASAPSRSWLRWA